MNEVSKSEIIVINRDVRLSEQQSVALHRVYPTYWAFDDAKFTVKSCEGCRLADHSSCLLRIG